MSNDRILNTEIDLDFVRYASDIKQSKSLKMFIDSGREKRERSRKPVSSGEPQSNGELSDTGSTSSSSNRASHRGLKSERLGPEGCERPVITSVCTSSVPRNQSPSLSSTSSNDGTVQPELAFIREKMHDATLRLRELEDQVKTIPKLQGQGVYTCTQFFDTIFFSVVPFFLLRQP